MAEHGLIRGDAVSIPSADDSDPDPWIAWCRKRFALAELLDISVADTAWMVTIPEDAP